VDTSVVVLDFETTGLSPYDSRVIEVAAVRVEEGDVTESFVQLMHPGFAVPSFITALTGISTAMVAGKPSPEEIMPKLGEFIGSAPVVAHNASFDMRFLRAEMERAEIAFGNDSLCTMRLARRLVPGLRGYSLGNLVNHLGISLPRGEQFHRALGDALVTVELWKKLIAIIEDDHGVVGPDLNVLQSVMTLSKARVAKFLAGLRGGTNATVASASVNFGS